MIATIQRGMSLPLLISNGVIDAGAGASVYLEIFKILGGGLFVALLTLYIQKQHYTFERMKESRRAYSEAKTAVDYLELRLSCLKLADAAQLLQQIHINKHMAEIYPELLVHLKRKGTNKSPLEWGDDLYFKLYAVRRILERHVSEWDELAPALRLEI